MNVLRVWVVWILVFTAVSSFFTPAVMAQPLQEPRPEGPQPAPLTAEQLFRDAAMLVQQKQSARAMDAFQQGLKLAPNELQARLALADLLLEGGRAAEAASLLRAAPATQRDPALDLSLLKALRVFASPFELAMHAEAALARHPQHPVLLRTGVEALLDVGAHERAKGYWERLPPAERVTPVALWLLGRLHESANQPAEAWASYTRAGSAEPRAKAALQRLAERQLRLDGWRYFPPVGWSVLQPDSGLLLENTSGIQARIALHRGSSLTQAAEASLSARVPLTRDRWVTALSQPGDTTDGPLQLTVSDCLSVKDTLCVHVRPVASFADMLPEMHLAALSWGVDVWVVGIDNVARSAALPALRQLAQAERLYRGDAP